MIAAGLAERALVVGGDVLSRMLDWTDRSTLRPVRRRRGRGRARARSATAASSASSSARTAAADGICAARRRLARAGDAETVANGGTSCR